MKSFKLNFNITFILVFFFTFISQAQVKQKHLVTSNNFDKITKHTTYLDLLEFYGKENVIDNVYELESSVEDTIKVTLVYPNTSKEMTIFWKENFFHKKISSVESANSKNSPYTTVYGLKAGSSLKKILQLNKKKISFLGFGWDLGGNLLSFNKGNLSGSKISFMLDCNNQVDDKLWGDSEFDTDMALVKTNLNNIYIDKIKLTFD